jgi:hypothetical protein
MASRHLPLSSQLPSLMKSPYSQSFNRLLPKKKSDYTNSPLLDALKITNWDEVQLHTMKFRKIIHMMLHPFLYAGCGYYDTKMIEVEIEGEIKNGGPHGQCFLRFIYKGALENDYGPPSLRDSPSTSYLDGQGLTFRGTGMFVEGFLSRGPALLIDGKGCALSFSWMLTESVLPRRLEDSSDF